MDDWPEYITKAFEAVCLAGREVDAEKAIESFASRWGGLDLDIFKQVLEEGRARTDSLRSLLWAIARNQKHTYYYCPF